MVVVTYTTYTINLMVQQIPIRTKQTSRKTVQVLIPLAMVALLLVFFIRGLDPDSVSVSNLLTRDTIQSWVTQILRYTFFFTRMFHKIKPATFPPPESLSKPNFADIFGGALIMTKSLEARNTRNILQGDDDKYMYMERKLPIFFVIGLKQEIAVSGLSLKSKEMYSSIVKHFIVEGSFSFPTQNWTHLGSFKANNSFQEQQFSLTKHVVRYLKVTITSTYGSWMYFTLTQIKVTGDGIFADALKQTNIQSPKSKDEESYRNVLVKYDHQQVFPDHVRVSNGKASSPKYPFSPNTLDPRLFKRPNRQVHQNIISDLLSKINSLERLQTDVQSQYSDLEFRYEQLQTSFDNLVKRNMLVDPALHFKLSQMQQDIRGCNSFWRLAIFLAMFIVSVLAVVILGLYVYMGMSIEDKAALPRNGKVKRRGSARTIESLQAPT